MSFLSVYRDLGVVIVEHGLEEHDLATMAGAFPPARAGVRRPIAGEASGAPSRDVPLSPAIADWLETHPALIEMASRLLRAPATLVRIDAFDETQPVNWLLAWRQRRLVALAERHRVRGFKSWVPREGFWLAEPPEWVLEQSVIMRIYLEDCRAFDGPLEIATGTHEGGALKRVEMEDAVQRAKIVTCLCSRGDIMAFSPLSVHRRHRAMKPRRLRVLELTYSAARLPAPLEWASLTPELEMALEIW